MRIVGGQRWPRARRSLMPLGARRVLGPPRLVPVALGDWQKIRDGNVPMFTLGWQFAPVGAGVTLAPVLQTNPESSAHVADLHSDPWRAAATASQDLAATGGRLVARMAATKTGASLADVVPGAAVALFATAAHAGAWVRMFGADLSLGFGAAALDAITLPAAPLADCRVELQWMRSIVDEAIVLRARSWPASDAAPTEVDPWQVTAAVDLTAVDALPSTAVVVANAGEAADFVVSNKFGMEATLEYTWAVLSLEVLDRPPLAQPVTISGAPLTVNGPRLTTEVDS